MGKAYVTGTLIEPRNRKEFEFLVDTCSTYIGLPQSDIEELGLEAAADGWVEVLTSVGVGHRPTYLATGSVEGQGFGAMVIEAPIPLLGYEILEGLRFRVNPVSQQLERVPPGEIAPPFQL